MADPARNDARGVAAVLRVGLPIGIATGAELGVFVGARLYTARFGAAEIAAHALALRTAGVGYAVPAAPLQVAMVRMARAEALGDPGLVRSGVVSSPGLGSAAAGLLRRLARLCPGGAFGPYRRPSPGPAPGIGQGSNP